jgi:hypothetical protein
MVTVMKEELVTVIAMRLMTTMEKMVMTMVTVMEMEMTEEMKERILNKRQRNSHKGTTEAPPKIISSRSVSYKRGGM